MTLGWLELILWRPVNQLVGLSYSPWSERARWALDHHRVPYQWQEYTPLLGEAGLRRRLWQTRGFSGNRSLLGRITVPVLFTAEGQVFDDSLKIARLADETGGGPTLFPAEHADAIDTWIQRSELVLDAGRSLTVRAVERDVEARAEVAPDALPRWLKPTVAGIGASYLRRKFAIGDRDPLEDERAIDRALDTLGRALSESAGGAAGGTVLPSGFSFADIAMAVSLHFVLPPDSRFLQIGRATRRTMTRKHLAEKHRDLVRWRDRLLEARAERRGSASAGSP